MSSAFDEGRVQYTEVTSERGRTCRILNPWPGSQFRIYTGTDALEETTYAIEDELISFETVPGSTYRVMRT